MVDWSETTVSILLRKFSDATGHPLPETLDLFAVSRLLEGAEQYYRTHLFHSATMKRKDEVEALRKFAILASDLAKFVKLRSKQLDEEFLHYGMHTMTSGGVILYAENIERHFKKLVDARLIAAEFMKKAPTNRLVEDLAVIARVYLAVPIKLTKAGRVDTRNPNYQAKRTKHVSGKFISFCRIVFLDHARIELTDSSISKSLEVIRREKPDWIVLRNS